MITAVYFLLVCTQYISKYFLKCQASQMVLVIKNPPANAGEPIDHCWEDSLEEEVATHS